MKPLSIIKIGGKLLDEEKSLKKALKAFSSVESPKILVHGGGKRASAMCLSLGIEPLMHDGRRITDKPTLEVATMVYAGLINKNLVSRLQKKNCNAMGFSGADGNLISAHKRPSKEVDFGFAGDVDKVNTKLLRSLLKTGIVPVFCAITHNKKGQLLNTNADTIATVLASALSKHYDVSLAFCFEKEGVLADPEDDSSSIPVLTKKAYAKHQKKGTISAGMIPKLDNAFSAKKANVHSVRVCGIRGILNKKGTEIC